VCWQVVIGERDPIEASVQGGNDFLGPEGGGYASAQKTGLRAKNQEHISEKDIYKQREVA